MRSWLKMRPEAYAAFSTRRARSSASCRRRSSTICRRPAELAWPATLSRRSRSVVPRVFIISTAVGVIDGVVDDGVSGIAGGVGGSNGRVGGGEARNDGCLDAAMSTAAADGGGELVVVGGGGERGGGDGMCS